MNQLTDDTADLLIDEDGDFKKAMSSDLWETLNKDLFYDLQGLGNVRHMLAQ